MNEMALDRAKADMSLKKPVIFRDTSPGLDITRIIFSTHQELHLSLRPVADETPPTMVSRLAGLLKTESAAVVRHEVFGSIAAHKETVEALQRDFEGFNWPVTWVEGMSGTKPPISGMHVFAVVGILVETVYRKKQPMGRVFSDGSFKHCLLGGIISPSQNASKAEQCREVLEQMADVLSEVGMDMTNVVRTWFFLDEILGWYGDFNRVRNEFFHERKVFNGLVPASTGIGGRNPAGSALVAGAWSVLPENKFVTVREVASPLQCPATDYGSAFSRAILMEGGGLRRLLVSGTASIEPGGQSMHLGNVAKQIGMSLEVTRAILKSSGFEFDDSTRVTGYYKEQLDDKETCQFSGQCRQYTSVQAHICRPELLFEIELDAASAQQ